MLANEKVQEFDPFNEASNPPERTYDLFGKVEINAFAGAFQKGVRGGVPYDPAVHKKRHTFIDIYVQPLPEMGTIKNPKSLEFHEVAWSNEWAKITLPSIKALGFENVREINGRFARVAKVPTGNKYEKKDAQGNLTGEMADETTFKFVELFADEDACRAAYLLANGDAASSNGNSAHVDTPATPEDAEKSTAFNFLKVIVTNAARGKDFPQAQEAVAQELPKFPPVAKFFNANSPEVLQLITDVTGLPF
jgi:hypothetical protein